MDGESTFPLEVVIRMTNRLCLLFFVGNSLELGSENRKALQCLGKLLVYFRCLKEESLYLYIRMCTFKYTLKSPNPYETSNNPLTPQILFLRLDFTLSEETYKFILLENLNV